MQKYINDHQFVHSRTLSNQEHDVFVERVRRDAHISSLRYRICVWTFYTYAFAMLASVLTIFSLGLDIGTRWPALILFAICIVPTIVGGLLEIFLPSDRIVQGALVAIYIICLWHIALPTSFSLLSNFIIVVLVSVGLGIGLAFLLLRWNNCKKLAEPFKKALVDVNEPIVDCYELPDNEDNRDVKPRIIEVWPSAHFVYREDDQLVNDWKVSEVFEVSHSSDEYQQLQLLENGVMGNDSEHFDFYQRKMFDGEVKELTTVRSKLRNKLPFILLGSIWGCAFMVRFIENSMTETLEPGLSPMSWAIAITLGLIYPIKKFFLWRRLGVDVNEKLIFCLWKKDDEPLVEHVIESFLPYSRLMWTQGAEPVLWRRSDN